MVGLLLFWPARAVEEPECTENRTEITPERTDRAIEAEPEEDFENEYIEAALYASGYFREDVPLDGDTQALLRAACEETGIPYELAPGCDPAGDGIPKHHGRRWAQRGLYAGTASLARGPDGPLGCDGPHGPLR